MKSSTASSGSALNKDWRRWAVHTASRKAQRPNSWMRNATRKSGRFSKDSNSNQNDEAFLVEVFWISQMKMMLSDLGLGCLLYQRACFHHSPANRMYHGSGSFIKVGSGGGVDNKAFKTALPAPCTKIGRFQHVPTTCKTGKTLQKHLGKVHLWGTLVVCLQMFRQIFHL